MNEHQTSDSRSDRSTSDPRTCAEPRRPYVYRHAGISEREGTIPVWLIAVVVGLLVWSAYYRVRYWSPG